MAKPKNQPDLKTKAEAALADAKKQTADADAALKAAQDAKDDAAIAKAGADLQAAQELEKEAEAAVAALAPPPAPETEAAAEDKAQTFIQHLQDEIRSAEQAGKADAHAWLVGLESHLAELRTHIQRLEQEASPKVQALVADIKKLF